MASIVWRNKQRKWYAYFYDHAGKHRGKPLPASVPRKPSLTRSERLAAEVAAAAIETASKAVSRAAVDIETAAAYWLDDCKVGLSMRTEESYRSRIKSFVRHISPTGKRVMLSSVDSHHVRAWRASRLKANAKSTVGNDLKALSAFFQWAQREGMIDRNPCANVLAPRRERQETAIPSNDEIQLMLTLLADPRLDPDFRALGIFGALCGMRRNEVLSLTWNDINLESRFLRVLITKSKDPRNIPMSEQVYQFLLDLPQKPGPVFPSPYTKKGQQRSPQVAKEFNAWLAANGFPWTHKALRHWFNDSLRRLGLEAVARRHIVGHTTEAVNRIYCHPKAEEARPYVEKLAHQSDLRGITSQSRPDSDSAPSA